MNTERQTEFDYLKGLFMPFIFLVHAFQATGSDEPSAVSVIYIIATMLGAAIFIFVQGFGTAYKDHTPKDTARSGIRLVIYQYLSDLFYVLSLAVPYVFMKNSLSSEGVEGFRSTVLIYAQFTNIFFISGIIYLVLAVLERLKIPTFAYPVLAAVISIAAPIIYGTEADIPVAGYVLKLLIGEAPFVSFTPLYFLPYALVGVAVGRMYKRIEDKASFYKRLMPASLAVIVLWWSSVYIRISNSPEEFGSITDIASLESVMDYAYSCPDIWHVLASLAHIALYVSIIYFIIRKIRPGRICSQLLYYNRHITKYYAIHLAVYLVAFALNGYDGFTSPSCLLLTLLCMAVTEIIARGYNNISDNKPLRQY